MRAFVAAGCVAIAVHGDAAVPVPHTEVATGNMQCAHPFLQVVTGSARHIAKKSTTSMKHSWIAPGGAAEKGQADSTTEIGLKANIKEGLFRIDENIVQHTSGVVAKDGNEQPWTGPEEHQMNTIIYDFTTKMVTKAWVYKAKDLTSKSGCTSVHVPGMPSPAGLVKAWQAMLPQWRKALPWTCAGRAGDLDKWEIAYHKKKGETMTPVAEKIFKKNNVAWAKNEATSYEALMEVGAGNRLEMYSHELVAMGDIDIHETYSQRYVAGSLHPPPESEFDHTSNKLGKCTHASAHDEDKFETGLYETVLLELSEAASKLEHSEVIV